MVKRVIALVALVVVSIPVIAQQRPAPPTTPRIYIFDNGKLTGLDPKMFGFTREEVKEPDLLAVSYLVVHPKGALMFDAGVIPDADFKSDGTPLTVGIASATRQFKPQLAAIGYRPSDVTYFALSHYHADHTANANEFAGATWIVQKAERDAMFAPKAPGITRPADYSALENAKTRVLDNADLDVFGDGTVMVKATPGHTPGHQVLFVKLAKTGPVVLAGDLYHYPEEVTTGRVPPFEWNADQAKASRAKVALLMKETGAALWIEHDIATHAKLPKAPRFVE
jgi:glyoxylase-like metal-dependent hydrolase (beta-lactamase superfamily II)